MVSEVGGVTGFIMIEVQWMGQGSFARNRHVPHACGSKHLIVRTLVGASTYSS